MTTAPSAIEYWRSHGASLLTYVANTPASGATPWNFGYTYNLANQRTQVALADGSAWNYRYDPIGHVTNGLRSWSDSTPVAGEQFHYTFDTTRPVREPRTSLTGRMACLGKSPVTALDASSSLSWGKGNRLSTHSGGDQTGNNLPSGSYAYNSLNEYTSRTVPGGFDVLGQANVSASVTFNGAGAYRHAEFYQSPVTATNSSGPVWQNVTVAGTAGSLAVTNTGHVLVHPTPEAFFYDLDGNLLSDGCWTNTWDGENRLVAMQSVAAVPTNAWKKLNFAYDYMSRRTRKIVSTWNGSAWVGQYTNLFLYDGWNLIAELNGANNSLIRSYIWGQDLSGTMQGAGGVGGLLVVKPASPADALFVATDANGNVAGLLDAANGSVAATYGYGPFGELIEMNSFLASPNPFRFSTKYHDDETDLIYYGYRYYGPGLGRWWGRDPIGEKGGGNLHAFLANSPPTRYDLLGQTAGFGDLHVRPCEYCKCNTLAIKYASGPNWTWGARVFSQPDGRNHTGEMGDTITFTWTVDGSPNLCIFKQIEKGGWVFSSPTSPNSPYTGPGNGDFTVPSYITEPMNPAYSYGDPSSLTWTDHPGMLFKPADAGVWTVAGALTITLTCKGTDNTTKSTSISIPGATSFTVPITHSN